MQEPRSVPSFRIHPSEQHGEHGQIETSAMAIEVLTPGIDFTSQQLEAAIERDEFELYYHPLINLADASICGVEALIRWNHPRLGQLMPAQFIPLAEESGLIVRIGEWVLRQACTELRLMRPEHQDLLLSVNVSARQLDEPDYIRGLAEILEETGVPARLLQLEITESIFLRDAMRVGALFQAIRALGVKIAFDDFGTGYSSLSYVEKYPVDLLKVDQSFVRRMNDGEVSKEIVQLIVRLARAVGIDVSAEGVESPDQATALLGLGCRVAQGYLYSRPVPLHRMVAMLEVAAAGGQRKSARAGVGDETVCGVVKDMGGAAGLADENGGGINPRAGLAKPLRPAQGKLSAGYGASELWGMETSGRGHASGSSYDKLAGSVRFGYGESAGSGGVGRVGPGDWRGGRGKGAAGGRVSAD